MKKILLCLTLLSCGGLGKYPDYTCQITYVCGQRTWVDTEVARDVDGADFAQLNSAQEMICGQFYSTYVCRDHESCTHVCTQGVADAGVD